MNNIKFTIIIPTRERPDTLLYTLKTVINQDYDNFDIIVSDNFSQDDTKEIVDSFKDYRIKYINPGKRLSMASHWEFALSHVKYGWVTFLGDDDGLIPGALSLASDIINKTNVYAISSIKDAYGWKGSLSEENRLIIYLTKGFEIRETKEWLKKWIYYDDAITSDLPNIYTSGFVDIEIINRARNKDGKFFLSLTPDVYSAFAISSVIEKYAYIKEPIFVAGASRHSTGASSSKTNSETLKVFYEENDIKYHNILSGAESISSIPIGIYDCYLKTIFLHNDFLKLKVDDQLAFALSRVSTEYYDLMIDLYKKISKENELDFNSILLKSEKIKKQTKFPKLKEMFDYLFNRRTIYDCTEYGVKDIYTATILAKSIHLQEVKYSNWRISIILKLFYQYKSIIKSLKTTFLIIHKSR